MPKSPHFFQKEQIIIQKQSSRCVLSKRFTTLLKSHFGKGVLLWICCIFSEQLFLRTPLDICLWPLLFTVVHLTDSRHSAPVDKFSKITDGLCYAQVFLSKFCRATFLMVLCFDCWRESYQFFTSSSFIWFWIFCYLTRYYEFQWISFTNITIEFSFQKFSRSFSNWVVFPSLFRRLLVEINITCWITCKIHPCGDIIMLDW